VLSTTTNTGFEVAAKTYPDMTVFYFPLDFTWAVQRALHRVRPRLIVLAELELWPNLVMLAKRQAVQIAVVNARMSPRSFAGYRRIHGWMASLLRRIDLFAVQNQEYADRLLDLGAPADRLHVTGSVKYDGVNTDRANPKTAALGALLGLSPHTLESSKPLIWIVGSTQAPEEQIALDIYRRALHRFPTLRLILVPRHQERFNEVADLLHQSGLPFLRRSQISPSHLCTASPCHPILLLDTLGELGSVWGLADVAFVGGSLTQRGGQNMIEPAAYGAAVTFGPHVWNFQETVDRLLECGGAVQVQDAAGLERETLRLLGDHLARASLGRNAQAFVQSQQGATDRTLTLLEELIAANPHCSRAA
jgi:3-deoxy-D-manno-octulosonic-acid transferase